MDNNELKPKAERILKDINILDSPDIYMFCERGVNEILVETEEFMREFIKNN